MLRKKENQDSYEYGKKVIFLLTFGFATLGFIINLILFFQNYTFWLKLNNYITIPLLIVILILYLRDQSRIHIYFGLLSWVTILSMFIDQLLFSQVDFFLKMLENIVLRNLIFVMSIISLTAFISSKKNLVAQVLVLFCFLIYYSFFSNVNVTFLTENVFIIIIVVVGFSMAILFFTKYLNTFIGMLNQQQFSLEANNKELLMTLEKARVIQDFILTDKDVVTNCFPESFICFEPKNIVSGDFYWVEKIGDKRMFAVGDCTGHGVSGAITSMTCHQALLRSVKEFNLNSTGEILDCTRNNILQNFSNQMYSISDGMDIALCSIQGNILEYSGANIPLWIFKRGMLVEYKADKQPIGIYVTSKKYKTHRIELEEGDRIYLASDGYADQFGGEKGKKMKTRAFKRVIEYMQEKSIANQGNYLLNHHRKWRGDIEQIDDVCVLGISFKHD